MEFLSRLLVPCGWWELTLKLQMQKIFVENGMKY